MKERLCNSVSCKVIRDLVDISFWQMWTDFNKILLHLHYAFRNELEKTYPASLQICCRTVALRRGIITFGNTLFIRIIRIASNVNSV